MAFLNDTMTDTAGVLLTAHTGELGATWTLHTSWYTGTEQGRISDANRFRPRFGGDPDEVWFASGTPSGADYETWADCYYAGSSSTSADLGIGMRIDPAAKTGIFLYWDEGVAWTLDEWVAGVLTNLGTSSATSLTATQTYVPKIQVVGSAVTAILDGSTIITGTTTITTAGRAGIFQRTNNDGGDGYGLHIDRIQAADIAAGGSIGFDDGDGPTLIAFPASRRILRLY